MKFKKLMKNSAIAMGIIATVSIGTQSMAFATSDTQMQKTIEIANEELLESDVIGQKELEEWFRSNGVDANVIESLMKKIKNNELIDSINPEKMNQYERVNLGNGMEKRIYEDGSISIFDFDEGKETKEESKDSRGLKPGTPSKGSGYINYTGSKVSMTTGVLNMSYSADYTFTQNGYDRINRIYNMKCKTTVGSWDLLNFKVSKARENLNGPAQAKLEVKYNILGGHGSSTNYALLLNVGKDTATAGYY